MGNNGDIYYQPLIDPFNSDTQYYYRVQSDHYSGAFADVTAPASANFPGNGSPTRYFVELPMAIDVSDLSGARPILVYNVTDTTLMTRVSASPGAQEYRVPPSTSNWRNVIEINSAQASDVLGFDYYGLKSIINAERANYIYNTLFTGTPVISGTPSFTGNFTSSGNPTFSGNPDFQDSFASGRKVTGYLQDTNVTQDEIFDALSASIPNVDDIIIVSGSAVNDESGVNTLIYHYSFSYALRSTSTLIKLYATKFGVEYNGSAIVGASGQNDLTNCTNGSGTVEFDTLTLAW